jgi:hypothetical protein
MKHKSAKFLILTSILCTNAFGQTKSDVPNMLGTWVGTSHTAVYGGGIHHPQNPSHSANNRQGQDGIRFRNVEFTYTIDQQDGRNFAGNSTSGHHSKERILGALSKDGKSGVMVAEHGGHITFKVKGNSMEICGTRAREKIANTTDAAYCTDFTRK